MNPNVKNIVLAVAAVLLIAVGGWVTFGRGGGSAPASVARSPSSKRVISSTGQEERLTPKTTITKEHDPQKPPDKRKFMPGSRREGSKKTLRGKPRKIKKESPTPRA